MKFTQMKKIIFAVLFVSLFVGNTFTSVSGEIRDLLREFCDAVGRYDLNKVKSLIKEGLYVDDTVELTYAAAFMIDHVKDPPEKTERFIISLIKTLSQAKADFSKLEFISGNDLTLRANVLEAFLDAGAKPGILLFMVLSSPPSSSSLHKIKILVKHKANLSRGLIWKEHAIDLFLRCFKFEYTEIMTEGVFNYVSQVIDILREAGGDTSDAKKYLSKLRTYHRNRPEALKYLDRIEKCLNKNTVSSFWDSLWNSDKNEVKASKGSVNADKVNIRTKPTTKSKVVKQLNAGHPVEIIESSKQSGEIWYHIRTASGTEGWVFGKYIN
ncbi:MAG: SH3 domain-containing protein [Synergistaceae bacterium]|nr:SH3 domain-containing protein [Synergistaceae bacterium]